MNLCDGTRSSLDVTAILKERHPEISGIGSDIHDFLDEMRRLGVTQYAK
ncbi:hypothetical protein MK489_00855 [Myxococcota bacterium]|nr:hypothetical protein [Myxococcota bacterium]